MKKYTTWSLYYLVLPFHFIFYKKNSANVLRKSRIHFIGNHMKKVGWEDVVNMRWNELYTLHLLRHIERDEQIDHTVMEPPHPDFYSTNITPYMWKRRKHLPYGMGKKWGGGTPEEMAGRLPHFFVGPHAVELQKKILVVKEERIHPTPMSTPVTSHLICEKKENISPLWYGKKVGWGTREERHPNVDHLATSGLAQTGTADRNGM